MASNNLMVGLEIGTSKICVVVGESRTDGTLKILGVGQTPSRAIPNRGSARANRRPLIQTAKLSKNIHEHIVSHSAIYGFAQKLGCENSNIHDSRDHKSTT